MNMFCYQCQETAKGTGCSVMGGLRKNTGSIQYARSPSICSTRYSVLQQ